MSARTIEHAARRGGLAFALLVASVWCGSGEGAGPGGGAAPEDGGGGNGFLLDAGPDSCTPACSEDLHAVTCGGTVVRTCSPAEGCAAGACVPACDAAIANKSMVGCEYYVHNPIMNLGDGRGCFAAFVANTWNVPVSFSGEAHGKTIDLSKYAYLPQGSGPGLRLTPLGAGGKLEPGAVAIVFLRDGVKSTQYGLDCPMPAADSDPNAVGWTDPQQGTNLGAIALRLMSSAPVVVYDILPFGGGRSEVTDAALVLPTSTWDTNYIAITPRPKGSKTTYPTLAIVASADDTKVTIRPTASIAAGANVAPSPAGAPKDYVLDRGQVLRFEQEADLLGSVIRADKPIGVWGEQRCISVEGYTCDGAHEQLPPVRALGSEYAVVRYRNRLDAHEETPLARLVGAVDGTELTYDPSAPPGAPAFLEEGQAVDVRASAPFVIRSQDARHPFYVAQYMNDDPVTPTRGAPEFVGTVPPAQYLRRYVFFTDPTYPETNLVFVRKRAADGTFKEVKLECGAPLSGWKPVGGGGVFEYLRWDIATGNFEGANGCDNGAHEAVSDGAFGLTVWGWGSELTGAPGSPGYSQAVSYAYVAGAGVQPINDVVVPPAPR